MLTKSEVIRKALIRAGVTPPDQTPTDAQANQVSEVLTSIHEDWVDRGVARWELENIPASLTDAVVSVAAYSIAEDFSVPASKYSRLVSSYNMAMRRINSYNEVPYSGHTVIQEY